MDASAELMALTDGLFLEVELRERDLPKFSRRVEAEGGPSLHKASEGVMVRSGLQGPNPRVYFNAEPEVVAQLAMFGYMAKEGDERGEWRKEYRYRIDNTGFFLKLVRNGYKLGSWPA